MKAKASLLILLALLSGVGMAWGATEIATIYDTQDDGFITEIGNKIWTAPFIIFKDPSQDIRAFLIFRNIYIHPWRTIENATLFLRTTQPQDFDADSAITIYGIDDPDFFYSYGTIDRYPLAGELLSAPLTDEIVNVNTSQFYGAQWNTVDLTDMVREMITTHYDWDRDDTLGFMIYSVPGDTRQIVDSSYGASAWTAYLNITYGGAPGAPVAGYEYVNSSRGLDIWVYNQTGWLNYTSYAETDGPGEMTVFNSSYVTVTNVDANDNIRLTKSAPATSWNVRFGVNVTEFDDLTGTATRFWNVLFGTRDDAGYPHDWDTDLWFFGIESDLSGDDFNPYIYFLENGVNGHKDTGANQVEPWARWIHVQYDMISEVYQADIYHDMEMTNLDESISGTNPWNVADAQLVEFGFGTVQAGYSPVDEGDLILMALENAESYFLYNGSTLLDEYPIDGLDPDDVLDEIYDDIDEIYAPDPHDPEPPVWEDDPGQVTRFQMRFYFLIIGLTSLFGPPLFFCYRRPSGYIFIVGLLFMIFGLALLIQIPQV